MIQKKSLEQFIFLCMCGFALTVSMKNSIADILSGIALLVGAFYWYRYKTNIHFRGASPFIIALGSFFAVCFLLIFISGDIGVSARAYWRYLNRMIPFLVVLFFISDRIRLYILFACALFSLCINNIYIIYAGTMSLLGGDTYIRAAGFSGDMIAAAGFLLIYLPITIVLLQNETSRIKQIFYLGLIIVGGLALVLNGTRIAWFTMVVLIPCSILLYGKNIKKTGLILLASYLILGILAYQTPFIQARIDSFSDPANISNQGHIAIKQSAFNMIKDKPFLGHGLGFFPDVFNEKYINPETKRVEGHISHAHNDTLLIGAEAGIVGILIFWFMMGSLLYFSLINWLKNRSIEDLMFFMVTLGAVLQGFTDTRFGMHQVTKMYFFLMAIYLNVRYVKFTKY